MEHTMIVALLMSGIIQLVIGIYVMVQGRKGKNYWFAGLAFSAALYSFSYALELTADSATAAFACVTLKCLGMAFLPTFGILTVLEFTGKRPRVVRNVAAALIVFSTIAVGIMHSTNLHGLDDGSLSLTKTGVLTITQITPGPWHAVWHLYVNVSFVVGAALISAEALKAPAGKKSEYLLFLTSLLMPIAAHIIYSMGHSPYGIDLAPYSLLGMNVLLLLGLSPNRLFELLSAAKNRVFDNMDDIVFILNREHEVIEANKSASKILGNRAADCIGKHVAEVFDEYPQVVEFVLYNNDSAADIALDDEFSRVFRVRVGTIRGIGLSRHRVLLGKDFVMTNITNEVRMVQAMKDLADQDPLTGIPNRRWFYSQVERLVAAARTGSQMAVIMADVDRFKETNDHYGHKAGDEVLRSVASLLARSVRAQDLLARFGGEEFVIAVPGAGLEEAVALAERLRERIRDMRVMHDGRSIQVTASFGVAAGSVGPGFDVETLISQADGALYGAKVAGRDQVVVSNVSA